MWDTRYVFHCYDANQGLTWDVGRIAALMLYMRKFSALDGTLVNVSSFILPCHCRPWVAGISGGPDGCYSVALSGGYEDDVDLGEAL